MIVVTGGNGFIGKNLIASLRDKGFKNVISLDINEKSLSQIFSWLQENAKSIEAIYHLGAITDTTLTDEALYNEYNFNCSVFIWNLCVENSIPLVYASSAATYGDGRNGFDDEESINRLSPLNPYGWSKHRFDLWVLEQTKAPPYWAGLKFFNVYGYGEAHKGSMASVIFHFYNQVIKTGCVKQFKSHRDDIAHGEQKRDFVYVQDVVDVCIYLMKNKPITGIFNVGTGLARSYNEVANIIFSKLGISKWIEYIDTPISIRDQYQYFTQASMIKIRVAGYKRDLTSLEDGIAKYLDFLNYDCFLSSTYDQENRKT